MPISSRGLQRKRYFSDSIDTVVPLTAACNRTKQKASDTLKEYSTFIVQNGLMFFANHESPTYIALNYGSKTIQQERDICLQMKPLLQQRQDETRLWIDKLNNTKATFKEVKQNQYPRKDSENFTNSLDLTIKCMEDFHHAITQFMSIHGIASVAVNKQDQSAEMHNAVGIEHILTSILYNLGDVVNWLDIFSHKLSSLDIDR